MNILHGLWIPKSTQDFMQSGNFYIWIETDETVKNALNRQHPSHLQDKICSDFLKNELAITIANEDQGIWLSLLLPTCQALPLPSPELLTIEVNEPVTLENWQVYAFPLSNPLKTINNLHFLSCYSSSQLRVGSDFLFWYYFSQSLKEVLAKDQYIPRLLSRKMANKTSFYRRWQAVSNTLESLIQRAVLQMPLACSQHYEPESLLRHFTEVLVHETVSAATQDLPQVFSKKVEHESQRTFVRNYVAEISVQI